MGWLFTYGSTLKGQMEERAKPYENDNIKRTCLAKCFKGNVLRGGVLWSVHEVEYKDGRPSERWIACDLLEYRKDMGWGYKDMDERMGPFYFSCPLKYLEMVPVDEYPRTTNKEWREEVIKYHAKMKEKRKLKKIAA